MTRWSARRWLRDFRAAGGVAWFGGTKRLHIGWPMTVSEAQHAELRRLTREALASDARYRALTRQALAHQ